MKKELKKLQEFVQDESGFDNKPTSIPVDKQTDQQTDMLVDKQTFMQSDNHATRMFSARIPAPLMKEIKLLAVRNDTQVQMLLIEALTDLLKKYKQ